MDNEADMFYIIIHYPFFQSSINQTKSFMIIIS